MATPPMKTDVPGVFRRGDRYAYTYRKRGKQRWGTARTKAEARRLKRNAETDVERGEHRDASQETFGTYARQWIEQYNGRTSKGVRASTRTWYRQMLEARLIPYFDHERGLRLAEIEPRDVKALIAWLAEQPNPHHPGRTLGASTVGYHVAVIRALFADAVEEGVLRYSPTAGVRVAVRGPVEAEDEVVKAMTRAQLARLLDEFDDRWRLFFEFLTHSGLRISEVIEVRWGRDLDLGERPTLKLRRQFTGGEVSAPKSATSRSRPRWRIGCARLKDRRASSSSRRSRAGRSTARTSGATSSTPPPSARGVPWVSFHNFRHTCASLLFAAGKNVKQVQVWLGHSDPGFTVRTYIRLMDDGLGDADFLDGVTSDGAKEALINNLGEMAALCRTPAV